MNLIIRPILQVDDKVVPFVVLFKELFHLFNLVPARALLTFFLVGWVAHSNQIRADICKDKWATYYKSFQG